MRLKVVCVIPAAAGVFLDRFFVFAQPLMPAGTSYGRLGSGISCDLSSSTSCSSFAIFSHDAPLSGPIRRIQTITETWQCGYIFGLVEAARLDTGLARSSVFDPRCIPADYPCMGTLRIFEVYLSATTDADDILSEEVRKESCSSNDRRGDGGRVQGIAPILKTNASLGSRISSRCPAVQS